VVQQAKPKNLAKTNWGHREVTLQANRWRIPELT